MEQRPFCGAQLVLQSSVLTVFDLDKVNVTLKNAEIFGSVLDVISSDVILLSPIDFPSTWYPIINVVFLLFVKLSLHVA